MDDPLGYAGHLQRLIEGTGSWATGVTTGATGPKRFAGREAVAFGTNGKHGQQPFELRALACGTHGLLCSQHNRFKLSLTLFASIFQDGH